MGSMICRYLLFTLLSKRHTIIFTTRTRLVVLTGKVLSNTALVTDTLDLKAHANEQKEINEKGHQDENNSNDKHINVCVFFG